MFLAFNLFCLFYGFEILASFSFPSLSYFFLPLFLTWFHSSCLLSLFFISYMHSLLPSFHHFSLLSQGLPSFLFLSIIFTFPFLLFFFHFFHSFFILCPSLHGFLQYSLSTTVARIKAVHESFAEGKLVARPPGKQIITIRLTSVTFACKCFPVHPDFAEKASRKCVAGEVWYRSKNYTRIQLLFHANYWIK